MSSLCPSRKLGSFHPLNTHTAENHVTSKQQQWRIPLKNPVYSGKTFFDISVNTGQIGMGFEADTRKMTATCPTYATFRQRSG